MTSSLQQPSRIPAEYRSAPCASSPRSAWGGQGEGSEDRKRGGDEEAAVEVHNLLDSYLAFLLAVLIKCGLLECLTVRAGERLCWEQDRPYD